MPKIPRAQGRSRLTRSPVAPRASASEAGAAGRTIEHAGRALGGIADHFKSIQALEERTTVQNQASRAIMDINFKAQNDPNPRNTDQYIQKIAEIRGQLEGTFTTRTSQLEFESTFDTMENNAIMKLKQGQRVKQIDLSKVSMLESLDIFRDQYIESVNPTEQRQFILAAEALIDENTALGVLTAESGFLLKKTQRDDFMESEIKSDMMIDAQSTMDRLLAGDYEKAIGGEMDPQKKNQLIAMVQKILNKQKAEAKSQAAELQNETEAEVAVKVRNNDIGMNELDDLLISGKIDKEFYRSSVNLLSAHGDPTPKQEIESYQELSEMFVKLRLTPKDFANNNDIKDLRTFRNRVMELRSKSLISEQDAENWIKRTSADWIKQNQPKHNLISSAISGIKRYGEQYLNGMITTQLIKRFMAKVDEGIPEKDIEKVAMTMTRDATRQANPELGLSGDVNEIGDESGVTSVMDQVKLQPQARPAVLMQDPETGRLYNIPEESVEEILKRGLKIVEDVSGGN